MSMPLKKGHRLGPQYLPLNISAPFIRRPVATVLITLAITLAGIVAFTLLPVASLPQMDFPIIRISTRLPGAGPETIATTVTTPLERALGRIDGITEITSQSSLGSSSVVVQFDLDKNIHEAAREVQAAINIAIPNMPPLPSNPAYHKVNPSGMPIMILAVTSDVHSPTQLYNTVSTVLAPRISQLIGVGDVSLGGGALPSIRINIKPQQLHHTGISLDQVASALRKVNAHGPLGMLDTQDRQWLVGANTQLHTPEEYRNLIIAEHNGQVLRLGDVADIHIATQDTRNAALVDHHRAILLMIYRTPGANVIETVNSIHAILPQLRAMLPKNAHLHVSMDNSPTIRSSLHEVEFSLLLSITLVMLVTFLFLRNARATTIPAVAVVVSLIATFAVMYLCGYSLNNLSLMALTIATGFVVDDAIVVLENIIRHHEKGFSPWRAAMLGAKEVSFTVISITLSLVAVFIPILFMDGIIGRLFREFSVVLACAVLISMFISLSTTPMMCAHLLKNTEAKPSAALCRYQVWLETGWQNILKSLENAYAASLRIVLLHKNLTLCVLIGIICLNVYLFIIVPKGFFPQQDTGQIMGSIRTDQSLSFQALHSKMQKVMAIILQDPAVNHMSTHFTGGRGGGFLYLELKPRSEHQMTAEQILTRLRKKLAHEPGIEVFLQSVQDLRVGGRSSRAQYQYTLQADDLEELRRWGKNLEQALGHIAIFKDVNSDMEQRAMQTYLEFDRNRMAQLGVRMKDVDSALGKAFGQAQIETLYTTSNQYKVVMELDPKWLEGPDALDVIYVPAKAGLIPLSAICTVGANFTARSVAHQGQFAAATISFNLAPGVALSKATAELEKVRVQIGMPASITGSFQGSAKLFTDTLMTQALLIVAAFATLYIVLGILYESLIHPLTILSTLPSASVGALLALMLCGKEFSLIALIGILLLCGLVKKNAILMIDFALDASRNKHLSPRRSIYNACILRFRPIMMTTFAAILGALPLALGTGDGAELRQPLGITIVGGLLFSQLLTLYTTPVVYLYLDKWRKKTGTKARSTHRA